MPGHLILLHLIGGIALLLWGADMVKTAMLRGFGGELRNVLSAATAGRLRAVAAGTGAALALQSSTATAMLLTGFVGRGLVALAPALAVMLGADLGTTLVVQVLSFDLAPVVPVLLIAGVGAALLAGTPRMRQVGRIVIGFGLILLALGLIVEASEPIRDSPLAQQVLQRLAADAILAVLIAGLLTWLFHSSVAFVLFVMSLTGAGTIDLPLAVMLVLGANLGAGLVPLGLAAGAPAAARRVLYGNLGFRAAGVLLALLLADRVTGLAGGLPGDPAHQVAQVHTLFNLALLLVCLPLTGLAARLLLQLFPETEAEAAVRPSHLNDDLLDRAALALNAATRELLAMADTVELMLQRTIRALEPGGEGAIEEIRTMERSVDLVQDEIKLYLVRLMQSDLGRRDSARVVELLLFTTNLEHVGDIIDKGLLRMAEKRRRLDLRFSEEGWRDICAFHASVVEQMHLALTVLVSRDVGLARDLVAEKDRLRSREAAATERHLERLREGTAASIETSALHLDILRDLKRINAHLTSVANPILEERGLLRGSRLTKGKAAPVAGLERG
jgi:phosphate:Na+ symporter